MSFLVTDSKYGSTVHAMTCSLAPSSAYVMEDYEIPANAEPCGQCHPDWSGR